MLNGPELLAGEIRRFSSQRGSRTRRARARGCARLAARLPEAMLATVASAGMWLLLVPGATVGEFERSVPVVIENLPPGYTVESIEPTDVDVVFRGRRRDGYLASQQAKVSLHVDALLVQLGRRSFDIGPEQVQHPEELDVISVNPTRIKLDVVRNPAVSSGPPGRRSGRLE